MGFGVCTASFWRITKIHTSTAISFFSRKILHDHRVWTNCPSVMPAKVSRLNSITNPPTHGFMNLYQRQLFQRQTGPSRPFQRKPLFMAIDFKTSKSRHFNFRAFVGSLLISIRARCYSSSK